MTNGLTNIVSILAGLETKHHADYGEQLLQSAPQVVIGIAIGLLLGWRAHIFACRRDDRSRLRKAKDEFLTVLGRLESRIPQRSMHIDSWTEVFHRESIVPLRDAVFTVRTFLSAESAARILDLWHHYEDENADAKSALIARTSHELQRGAQSPAMPPYPDDMLRTYMQRFREEITSAV